MFNYSNPKDETYSYTGPIEFEPQTIEIEVYETRTDNKPISDDELKIRVLEAKIAVLEELLNVSFEIKMKRHTFCD